VSKYEHPDHDTIAAFRRHFLPQIRTLFVQVLGAARETGMLKMGTVALDGTKIHANASRDSALSYEHAGKIKAQLQAEVAELMAKAEAADQAGVRDGMSIPEELVPLHSGSDWLRPGELWDHWSDPKYDLLELSLLKSRPEHRSACQRSLPGLAASGANLSKPLCRGTSAAGEAPGGDSPRPRQD